MDRYSCKERVREGPMSLIDFKNRCRGLASLAVADPR